MCMTDISTDEGIGDFLYQWFFFVKVGGEHTSIYFVVDIFRSTLFRLIEGNWSTEARTSG